MAKMPKNLCAFLLLMTVVLGMSLSCQLPSFLSDKKVAEMSNREGDYIIDPNTILESLNQGKTDVFYLQTTTQEDPIFGKPVQWGQIDYFQIVDALHKFVWSESLEDWGLERMLFKLDCMDVNNGPQSAAIQFFKIIHTREQGSRLLRDFWIDPSKGEVSWHEVEYYPNVLEPQVIDLSKLKIPVETALQIAEQNGGVDVRSEVEDACTIYLILAPGSKYDGWQVTYSGYDPKYNAPTNLFEIRIDPLTGEHEIISSEKR